MLQCVGQELNLHIPEAAALQAVGLANAQPTHVVPVARVVAKCTNDHEGFSFATLPDCVPRHSISDWGLGIVDYGLTEQQIRNPKSTIHYQKRPRWDSNPRSPA